VAGACQSRVLRKLPLKMKPKYLITNTLKDNASASSGFPNNQYFFVSVTEGANCVLSSSWKCCYRTFNFMNTYMGLAYVAC